MIDVKNITKKFGKNISLNSVSTQFNSGDSVALMGANGAGKTTLIRMILGYYHANEGSITVNGLDPIKNRVDILKYVSFVPQLPPPIKLSVDELLHFVEKSSGVKRDKIYHYVNEMNLNIKEHLNKSFFSLSGGMKQKLLIGISAAKDSSIYIYDEPTANLDPKARENFYKILQEQQKDSISLFVTHRIEEVKDLVNREIYMDLGEIVSDEHI